MTTNNLEGPLRFLAHAFVSPHSDILDAIRTEEAAGFRPVGLLNNVSVQFPSVASGSKTKDVEFVGAGIYLLSEYLKKDGSGAMVKEVKERVILPVGGSFNVYSGVLRQDSSDTARPVVSGSIYL